MRSALPADTAHVNLGDAALTFAGPLVELWDDDAPPHIHRPAALQTDVIHGDSEPSFGGVLNWRRFRTRFDRALVVEWGIATVPGHDALVLDCRMQNCGGEPVRVDGLGLTTRRPGGLALAGSADAWWLGFHKDTPTATLDKSLPSRNDRIRARWQSFGEPQPPFPLIAREHFDDGRWRKYRDWFTLTRDAGRQCFAGAAVGAEADVDFDFFIDPSSGHALEITSRMSGIRLDPGEWRSADRVVLGFDEFDAIVPWLFRWISSTLGTRLHRPPLVGWCSWYDRYRDVCEQDVREVSAAAARLRDRIPLQVIQVDDGYQRQLGEWEPNEKFPSGFEPLCSEIERAGAAPAVWIAPLFYSTAAGRNNLDADDRPLVERHPEWFQRSPSGELIGRGTGWGKPHYLLDPSHPRAADLIRQMLRRLKAAGFKYFKIDFNTLQEAIAWDPMIPQFHDGKKTRLQIYRDLYRLYRDTLGEDTYILSCVCELIRGPIGFADAQRIGPDSVAVWTGKANRCCIDACIESVAATAHANGILVRADPDVTYLRERGHKGPALTRDQWQTWHSIVGLAGGAVFISEPLNQPAYQDEAALLALEILTPPAPERAIPIHGGTDFALKRFGFVCRRPWGSFAVLLLHNPETVERRMPLDWHAAGLTHGRFHLWSFWDEQYLGACEGHVDVLVPPQGCRLLRITPASPEGMPVLIGSSLHVGMGSAEVEQIHATPEGLRLQLTDAGARSGRLYFTGPRPPARAHAEGIESVQVQREAPDRWTVHLTKRRRHHPQSLDLAN